MTHADIARLRLHNQQIAQSTFRTPGEVVAWMGAVQAQAFPGSKWAVGLRVHPLRFRGSGFNLTPGGVGQRQPLV